MQAVLSNLIIANQETLKGSIEKAVSKDQAVVIVGDSITDFHAIRQILLDSGLDSLLIILSEDRTSRNEDRDTLSIIADMTAKLTQLENHLLSK